VDHALRQRLRPHDIGFPASLEQILPPYFPNIAPSGYTTYGASRSFGKPVTESATWSWSEIVNKTIAASGEVGGEFRDNLDTSIHHHELWKLRLQRRLDAAKRTELERRLRQLDCIAAIGHAGKGSVPINPLTRMAIAIMGSSCRTTTASLTR